MDKYNVGQVDLNQAINMVTYYASSSEPASVRGKHVYIQYSNRHEIVNNKGPGDVPGNVLLVTIEGVEAGDVSIDVIHLALIQFSDAETASSAREALDGRSIPRHAFNFFLPGLLILVFPLVLAKFENRQTLTSSKFQPVVGPDGKKKEPESNVLLASIENMQYAVTVDVINQVFSAFGTVQKIAIFEKNGGTQALVQYPDITTAAVAKDALEGHSIYDGGYCKLHLSYSRHTDLNVKAYSDKSRDYTVPESGLVVMQAQQASGYPIWHNPQAAAPLYPGSEYAGGSVQPQAHPGQWDPAMQASRTTFSSGPTNFPGQSYGQPSMRDSPPGNSQNSRPGGDSPHVQPRYYS
ncbi:hypothetical protein LguiB_008951 [Lonicera macranthoides]